MLGALYLVHGHVGGRLRTLLTQTVAVHGRLGALDGHTHLFSALRLSSAFFIYINDPLFIVFVACLWRLFSTLLPVLDYAAWS